MLNQEQTQILEQAIILLFRLRDEQSIDNWENERARKFGELTRPILTIKEDYENDENGDEPLSDKDFKGFLKFTEKEILQMPKRLRISIRELNCTVYARKRNTGRYKSSYEIRFNRNGFNISASGRTKEQARKRFIEKARIAEEQQACAASTVPKGFHDFALYWFEKFHKRKVSEKTFDHDIKLYFRHIKDRFAKFATDRINAAMLQDFLDNAPGTGKTAKDMHSILKQILDCAVKHGIIKLNPLGMCILDGYDQKHGKLIIKEDENKLFNAYKGTEWELPFAIAFYCGLRPCEYLTITKDGNFIKAQNGKRKGGKIDYKRIAITPMLRPYLQNVDKIDMPKPRVLNNRLKKVLPSHKLYDMRTTFQTRCSECEINETVIGLFMGNSIGKLKAAYTDFSDEYLLSEAEKFKY